MRQIRAVLFDYGGVLRRDERASAYDAIDVKFGLAPGTLWWAFTTSLSTVSHARAGSTARRTGRPFDVRFSSARAPPAASTRR